MPSEFELRCGASARQFLLTVVVVDDGAYLATGEEGVGALTVPDRRTVGTESVDVPKLTRSRESLDATALVEAFSKMGLICSVIVPRASSDVQEVVLSAANRADIVVLDWRLNDGGEITLDVLSSVVQQDRGERLRLIAIYTGSRALVEIGARVAERLESFGLVCTKRGGGTRLECGSLRIVIYAKTGVTLEADLQDRVVPEGDVAKALVGDFAGMVSGLVPNLALMSLAAVRENTHRLIEKFHSGLDPAYLTQVACLGSPKEAQQHMVAQIASELQAIMGDAAEDDKPMGIEAIKEWLDAELGADAGLDCGGGRECTRQEILTLFNAGWEKGKPKALRRKDGFRYLTTGFSKGADTKQELDKELAWIVCCRTVVNAPAPILQMGSVVHVRNGREEQFLLCVKPKCDSVRLPARAVFLLLPLVEPKAHVAQLVLRTNAGEYRRVSVAMGMDDWMLREFDPSEEGGAVVATRDMGGGFYFVDSEKVEFHWLGELREEFAQQVAQRFAAELARIPVNNSEWLRREEGGAER